MMIETVEPVSMHDNFAKAEASEKEKIKGEGSGFIHRLF